MQHHCRMGSSFVVGFDWRAEHKTHVGHGIESEAPSEPIDVVRRYVCATVTEQKKW